MKPLLQVHHLNVRFPVGQQLFGPARRWVHAVNDVSLEIARGETVGLVGESGCGKSTLGRAILRLVEPESGQIMLDGEDITPLRGKALRVKRRDMQMVFQDISGSLNPRMTVGDIIGEALDIHRLTPDRAARRERIASLLDAVGLESPHASRYPHEFSGGQRQRIGIARALAITPRLLVCDEPVSALDVSVQAQIINLLQDLQEKHQFACLLIAHDLAVVEHASHRVMVMYLGRVMESAPASRIIRASAHPYTQALISAVPSVETDSRQIRFRLAGDPPSPMSPPPGCPFHPRCPISTAQCAKELPALREISPGHHVACHHA